MVDLKTGRTEILDQHVDFVNAAEWTSPNQFITGGQDGLLAAWDTNRGECLWTIISFYKNQEGDQQSVTFLPQGAIRHADPHAADSLVFLVERDPGHLEILTRSQFADEFPEVVEVETMP